MKKYYYAVLLFAAVAVVAFKSASDCSSYFPQKVGTKWEMTTYTDKDAATSSSKDEILSVSNTDTGVVAKVATELFDANGKSQSKGDFTLRCDGDKFYMDLSGMMPKPQMANGQNVSMEMTNEDIEFPSDPKAGDKLPDAQSTITMKMNGNPMMTMTVNLTNRKVEGFEKVTTPAGTFDCTKYSYDMSMKSPMMTINSHSILYLAKNTGMVKSQAYDDQGKIKSYTEMTSFTN